MEASACHIGLSVGSRSHAELWPDACEWCAERSRDERDLQRIAGVGPAYEERLRGAGIETLADLGGADPDALADEIDVSAERVRDWVDRANEAAGR
jgi:polyhydroxyalkanoate synthase